MISKLRRYEPSSKLSSLDRQSLSTLLLPLLKLRQACCHPQAVRGQFMSLQKKTMTMEQLLEQLISKVRLLCLSLRLWTDHSRPRTRPSRLTGSTSRLSMVWLG